MKNVLLNFKFKNYKTLFGAIQNVRSEAYILKMRNMKIQGAPFLNLRTYIFTFKAY